MSTSSVIPVMGVIDTFCERIYDRNKINIGAQIFVTNYLILLRVEIVMGTN